MRVRLLDLGTVPSVESQTIYHAIAHAMEPGSPDTISLMSPDRPYISVGFLQDVGREIDVEYCQANALTVLRREVGGGAVYLDSSQVFVHFIFHRERLPRNVEKTYELFIRPLVETYRALGINASHRPLNDIVVGDRKIGGTGIASIGEAVVVASSLMFDFDTATMARALKVSSEKMRDKVHQSLEEYMTTMRKELGRLPPRDEVIAAFREKAAATLDIDLEPGDLTAAERRMTAKLNRRFQSARWLRQRGSQVRPGVKIKGDIHVAEAEYKAPGGLIRVTARLRNGAIDDISVTGDFTFQPANLVSALETALRGQRLEEAGLVTVVRDFYAANDIQAPGTAPEDIVRAVIRLETAASVG